MVLFRVVFQYNIESGLISGLILWLLLCFFLKVTLDRSHQKRISLLIAEQKFRQAAAVTDLAIMVKHDIASPLTALQFVTATMTDYDSEKLSILSSSIQRIVKIVGDLDFVRGTNQAPGVFRGAANLIDISDMLNSIITNFQAADLNVKMIKYTFNCCAHAASETVTCDIHKLERIVVNLLSNSIDAIRNNGKISINTFKTDSYFVIQIKDSGKGIPISVLKRIGEKGYSYEKATGTGFGIYDAKENLASWGGAFNISSTEDLGTTTEISLLIRP